MRTVICWIGKAINKKSGWSIQQVVIVFWGLICDIHSYQLMVVVNVLMSSLDAKRIIVLTV